MKTLKLRLWLTALTAVGLHVARQSALGAVPQVYAGPDASSSFLLDGAGALSGWGYNGIYQLGIGSYAAQSSPIAVPFPPGLQGWRAVASSDQHDFTYAIGNDLQLYLAGWVSFASPANKYFAPITPIAGVGGWSAVAASQKGWLAVSTNGPIYGNINGSVYWPPRPGAVRWTQVALCSYMPLGTNDLFALDNRGKLFGVYSGTAWFTSPTFSEIPVPTGATAWTNIAAGGRFVLALANDGNLYAWGENGAGQLGLGFTFGFTNTPQRISLPFGKTSWKGISAGGLHSMASTSDGQLFVWGANHYGQLGLANNQPSYYATLMAVPNLTNVTSIAAGYEHSLAVVGCQVLAWGRNYRGQLGAGFTNSFYPLPISSQFTYDICSTNPPLLPLISIAAGDPNAAEGTWSSATNTGRFDISRAVATDSSLEIKFTVGGTASNGVDYLVLPSTITIPANSNSASLLVVPTGSILAADPSTVVITLLSDPAYQLGNPTNATVAVIQYESKTGFPLPPLNLQLFVGTNLNGWPFVIQSSTNLLDWTDVGIGTNVWGVVTVTDTNRLQFRQRFFRAFPLPSP